MNPVSRNTSDEDKKLIQEYLDNGGTVTKLESGARTEEIEFKGGFYTRRKKSKEEKEGKNS